MATTANGTPYVESSDLVANYPAVSLALAEHIDDNTGKMLQVVRATDTTGRTTTSVTPVDADISVTITPQRDTSAILLLWLARTAQGAGTGFGRFQITDSSNTVISGAEEMSTGSGSTASIHSVMFAIGYATPATTSPVTFKGRFFVTADSVNLTNNSNTGQLYAIEVAA
jgi:hypothetical protein